MRLVTLSGCDLCASLPRCVLIAQYSEVKAALLDLFFLELHLFLKMLFLQIVLSASSIQ